MKRNLGQSLLFVLACCMVLLCCNSTLGQERHSDSTGTERTELTALKVLNDSDWAHTVKPSLQDTPCTYHNPAFPGLHPKGNADAGALDAAFPALPRDPVKPDESEYLIRFQSAKPVQTAVQELLAISDQWSAYGAEKQQVSEDEAPTDAPSGWYNLADMITIAVILKRPGPDGTTLFDYGYDDNGRRFAGQGFHLPCAGLRTSDGQVSAHVLQAFGPDPKSKVLQLSFPRLIDGKPLIASANEKVEFRLVVNQRVFETTFYINASDVLDGSEKILYLPSAFNDANEIAQH